MICVQLVNYGQPQPSAPGQDLFVAYGSQSVLYFRNQASGCVEGQYVLQSADELQPDPFRLDNQAAVAIGGAILMLWGVAWLFRRAMKSLENSTESET